MISGHIAPPLPRGTVYRRLAARRDAAGSEVALHDTSWRAGPWPVQWNLVSSGPNTLRGVHVHIAHSDYLHVAQGSMLLALHDMRPGSETRGLSALLTLGGDTPVSIVIPPGVAHGFYFVDETHYFYGVSAYWDQTDELGCRWDDPALNLAWPVVQPVLSGRDRSAGSYRDLAERLAEAERLGSFAT